MKLILETVQDVKYLTEEKDGKKDFFIEGIFLQGDIVNRNGRRYPLHVLEKEVDRYIKEKVETKRAYGELGHPDGPSINLDRISHLITEIRQDGSNFIGKAKILPTPMGDIARNIIEGGGVLGVSTRGIGSLKEVDGIMEVQDDFQLATAADIVSDPSAPDAFVNGIMEGIEFWYTDDGRLVKEPAAEAAKKHIEESVSRNELSEERKLEIFQNYLRSLF